MLPATGGEMTPLTTDPTPDWNPRWSPDGNQIAFYAYRSGNRDIWVMPARGGPARQLTFGPAFDWFLSWSPVDGRDIAFRSQRGGEEAIWTVAAAGGEARRVTMGEDFDWSPDGRWLFLVRQGKLFRVPTDGGEPLPLSTGAHDPYNPRVSHDGRSVYYCVISGPPENHGLWKLSLAGRDDFSTDQAGASTRPPWLLFRRGRAVSVPHLGRGRRRHLGHGCRSH